VREATERAAIDKIRTNTELSALSTVKPQSSMTALRRIRRLLRVTKHTGKLRIAQTNGKLAAGELVRHCAQDSFFRDLVRK